MKKILILASFFLCGCNAEPPKQVKHCVKTETYTYTTMIMVGKSMIPQTNIGTRCVEYSAPYENPKWIEWKHKQETKDNK